ncbi:DUF4901 domain-containing protein [Brevibacillus humidisoli]|uniref:DUF4901 domain-containing protein n=1 Tax=Brevibacillus humidisoli TaxID=2895522 RepID=UPI001E459B33|nr:DUF4901 domain-containing protein [Brevibacillus humidisoli]UFJ40010.1 DUF4901 domain-containing protein [Brevibacillus humidisoli]
MKLLHKSVMTVIAASLLSSTPVWASAQEAVITNQEAVEKAKAVEVKVAEKKGEEGNVEQQAMSQAVEQSLDRLYQLVPELQEMKLTDQHLRPAENGRSAAWYLHFSNAPEQPQEAEDLQDTAHAYLSLKAETGELLTFNIQHPQWSSEEMPTAQLTKEKATAFMKQLLGDQADDYRLSDSVGYGRSASRDSNGNETVWTSASVQFERLIHGVPLINSGYQVEVDSFGHVTSIYQTDEDSGVAPIDLEAFPDPSEALTVEEAKKAYQDLIEMELVYSAYGPGQRILIGTNDDAEESAAKPSLQYRPNFTKVLDARTGKEADMGMRLANREELSKSIKLEPQGKELVAETPEDAAALLSDEFGIDMTGMRFDEREEMDWPTQKKFLHYSWHSEPKEDVEGPDRYADMKYVHVGIDAETGQVLNVSVQDESKQGAKPSISEDQAEKAAIQFLETYTDSDIEELMLRSMYSSVEKPLYPDWVDESKVEERMAESAPEFTFFLNESYQGIPIIDRSYQVTIDAVTGEVSRFYLPSQREQDLQLPDSSQVVTPEAAAEALFDANPPRMVYVWPEFAGQRAPQPWLLYISDYTAGGGYLDAITGKWVKASSDKE